MTQPKYRWACPHEWLEHHMKGMIPGELRNLIRHDLAPKLDHDTLQDIFQSDMDADGYFEDLNACEHTDLDGLDDTDNPNDHVYCRSCGREFPVEGTPEEKRLQLIKLLIEEWVEQQP